MGRALTGAEIGLPVTPCRPSFTTCAPECHCSPRAGTSSRPSPLQLLQRGVGGVPSPLPIPAVPSSLPKARPPLWGSEMGVLGVRLLELVEKDRGTLDSLGEEMPASRGLVGHTLPLQGRSVTGPATHSLGRSGP